MAQLTSTHAPAWRLIVGGKPLGPAVDDVTFADAVNHQRRIQVRRQSLGPQTVLLRPRWNLPADPARALPPLGIA
ncbi:MAG: hypothetical protein EXR52_06270 [Dehalococcoidia bacterium]|nr:hypothetical protein [Dehalococcoidia bacterium]